MSDIPKPVPGDASEFRSQPVSTTSRIVFESQQDAELRRFGELVKGVLEIERDFGPLLSPRPQDIQVQAKPTSSGKVKK